MEVILELSVTEKVFAILCDQLCSFSSIVDTG